MTVYVDEIREYGPAAFTNPAAMRFGKKWCHMTADSDGELHVFAARLSLKRSYFQDAPRQALRHYDLVPSKRAQAVRLGAVEVAAREHFKERLDAELAREGTP